MIWIVGTLAFIAIGIPFALALILPPKCSARSCIDELDEIERESLARRSRYDRVANAFVDDMRAAS